jgi:plastocyanin
LTTLDSRSLGSTDCFMKRFGSAGLVRYTVSRGFGFPPPRDETDEMFTIEVSKAARREGSQQHEVTVREEGGRLRVDRPQMEIGAGDFVVWHAADGSTPRFSVLGEMPKGAFSSAELTTEAVFTHPFGLPGVFRWMDANGSRLEGEVVVRPAEEEGPASRERWLSRLEEAASVVVRGTSAEPERVEIVVGQTVAWVFDRAGGVTVTDASLLKGGGPSPEAEEASKVKISPAKRRTPSKTRSTRSRRKR